MSTRIDRRLNLVIEIPRGDGSALIVHSTALPTEIFEPYFDLCGPTMNYLMVGGFGNFAPRYAALALREVAHRSIGPEMPDDMDLYRRRKATADQRVDALFAELHRLSFVLTLKGAKWEQMPLDEARNNGGLSTDEMKRIDSALVFFTLASESVPQEMREPMLGGLAMFGARSESSSIMEFVRSLQISTTAANSGKSQDALPPSSTGSQGTDSESTSGATPSGSQIVRRPTSAPANTIGSQRPSAR
ncbi:MAG: hypothetical protein WA634_07365 [Silvibacterium sp.]